MSLHRRQFLLAASGMAACHRPLAKPFNGYAFVAAEVNHSVAAVNLSRFTVSKQIPLDAAPTAVMVAPGSRRVFVLTPGNGTVTEIDANSLSVARKKRIGGRAPTMRLAPGGESLWVLTEEPPALTRLDLKTWKTGPAIKLHGAASDFDLSAHAPLAAVASPAVIVNLETARIERTLDIEGADGPIRFRPDGRQVLAGLRGTKTIAIADPSTGRLIVKLPLAIEPERFCFTTDNGGQMFVSGRGMDGIAIVSPYQNIVDQTLLAGRSPGNMAVDSANTYLFVTNPESGDLTVIAIADRRMRARISVGQGPNHVLITPDDQYALTLNEISGDMAVVRISKLGEDFRYKPPPLFTMIAVGAKP